jgi:hypothetical protein
MEPSENNQLRDEELDGLLRQWKTPEAPAHLRQAVFPAPRFPWWRKFWDTSIRIPLPVACGLVLLLAGFLWKWPAGTQSAVRRSAAPPSEVVQEQTETPAAPPKFQPVLELRPRIIKVQDAQN